jgi:SYP5 family syntaxin
MPSGFSTDTESWVKEFEGAKNLAQEVIELIQERNVNSSTGPEASRKTATARRKLGTLGTEIDRLLKWLESDQASGLSESEKNRRRDMLHDLRSRREQMQYALKRSSGHSERDALFQGKPSGSNSGVSQQAKETEATAVLDTRGLLSLQQQIMKNQDMELEHMEKAIGNTKHIAVAIGEEVDLQTRLLDDLQDDVDVTNMRMRAATSRVKQIIKASSTWKGGFCIFILIVTMVTLLVLILKLNHIFGS